MESDIVRFAKLVKLMRHAQTTVLRDRDHTPAAIGQCRDLERRVDRAVKWILVPKQRELYDQGEQPPTEGPYPPPPPTHGKRFKRG